MAKRPPADDDAPPSDEPANDGATAFVRVDDAANLRGSRGKPDAPPPLAPRKGLQVQLPDEEPPPPPKPKTKLAAAEPAGKKGRRGNWWDDAKQKLPEDEEPPADPQPAPDDDAAGATAFLRAEAPKPPPPRRRAREPEPEAPADNSTQFFRPDEHLLQKEAQKAAPRPAPVPEATVPWKLLAAVLGIGFVVVMLSVVLIYREAIFGKKPVHRPAAAGKSDTSDTSGSEK